MVWVNGFFVIVDYKDLERIITFDSNDRSS